MGQQSPTADGPSSARSFQPRTSRAPSPHLPHAACQTVAAVAIVFCFFLMEAPQFFTIPAQSGMGSGGIDLSATTANEVLYIGFNQDQSCFAVGTTTGFKVFNCSPFKEVLCPPSAAPAMCPRTREQAAGALPRRLPAPPAAPVLAIRTIARAWWITQ